MWTGGRECVRAYACVSRAQTWSEYIALCKNNTIKKYNINGFVQILYVP